MELRNLKTFHVVAEELNLTKAAAILSYTQPTITLQIQVLEREIGHALFNRVGKKTFLTSAGKQLKHHTDKLFAVMEELENTVRRLNHPQGILNIAAPEYYWTHHLSLFIGSFLRLHPGVNMQLISSDSKETIRLICENQADVGVIAGGCSNSVLEVVPLDKERMVLVAASESLESSSREQLFVDYPFITYKDSGIFGEEVKYCLSQIDYTPKSIIESESEELIRRAVLHKTGIGLISESFIKEDLENGDMIPLYYSDHDIQTSLIFLKQRVSEVTLQSFCQQLQQSWNSRSPS
ncbi:MULTISPECIES: LysR family transcriptional regulator [unclassified Paenibacillus]|uniref:LysR family transcriptional regulator n=1 Tax=unclassified Paenibacillus TaxID=185978 RepID=UPI0008955648|nr:MULTISPECIES: LysR family transcriptional regulator [unclassified Paenibacillus]OMC72353.1 hypothetical protein BK126_10310 [Paenibacillus sp. FSL H7-0326]SDX41756.1 DNA-binding transcriptional regulator, LysR family [Paenibacillus sp. PDC88]